MQVARRLLCFDDTQYDYIIDNTNKYAEKKIASMRPTRCGLYRNWQPVMKEEMKGFISVMGIIQLGDLKEYWSTEDTNNLPFFHSVFSRDRFFQIFGALHVGDNNSTTKRGKIQPFLDLICPAFEAAQQIAIDESVITFKGRVSFRQYLKGKRNPWGIKAFVQDQVPQLSTYLLPRPLPASLH